jgi:hypothetical protein
MVKRRLMRCRLHARCGDGRAFQDWSCPHEGDYQSPSDVRRFEADIQLWQHAGDLCCTERRQGEQLQAEAGTLEKDRQLVGAFASMAAQEMQAMSTKTLRDMPTRCVSCCRRAMQSLTGGGWRWKSLPRLDRPIAPIAQTASDPQPL